jgi:hypothetical protein
MTELSFEYWNQLANQFILTSSLLGGFSIAAVANILVSKARGRVLDLVMRAAIIASSSFIAVIFSMTDILMKTTPGYPFKITGDELLLPRVIGSISFFVGIFSLIAMIGLSGWTRSKHMGWFTTIIGGLTLILLLLLVS